MGTAYTPILRMTDGADRLAAAGGSPAGTIRRLRIIVFRTGAAVCTVAV